jgi:hypothetical protein
MTPFAIPILPGIMRRSAILLAFASRMNARYTPGDDHDGVQDVLQEKNSLNPPRKCPTPSENTVLNSSPSSCLHTETGSGPSNNSESISQHATAETHFRSLASFLKGRWRSFVSKARGSVEELEVKTEELEVKSDGDASISDLNVNDLNVNHNVNDLNVNDLNVNDLNVKINIGVWQPESRPSNETWIEFDPMNELRVDVNRIILPMVVVVDADDTSENSKGNTDNIVNNNMSSNVQNLNTISTTTTTIAGNVNDNTDPNAMRTVTESSRPSPFGTAPNFYSADPARSKKVGSQKWISACSSTLQSTRYDPRQLKPFSQPWSSLSFGNQTEWQLRARRACYLAGERMAAENGEGMVPTGDNVEWTNADGNVVATMKAAMLGGMLPGYECGSAIGPGGTGTVANGNPLPSVTLEYLVKFVLEQLDEMNSGRDESEVQSESAYAKHRKPSVASISLLDLDTQGLDVPLLYSLSATSTQRCTQSSSQSSTQSSSQSATFEKNSYDNHTDSLLDRISRVKIECQDLGPTGWLYEPYKWRRSKSENWSKSKNSHVDGDSTSYVDAELSLRISDSIGLGAPVFNDCSVATRLLERHGFRVKRQISCCAAQEFNLIAKRQGGS